MVLVPSSVLLGLLRWLRSAECRVFGGHSVHLLYFTWASTARTSTDGPGGDLNETRFCPVLNPLADGAKLSQPPVVSFSEESASVHVVLHREPFGSWVLVVTPGKFVVRLLDCSQ